MATPIRRLGEQFEDLAKQDHAARLAMWVFLASELLLFAALFALYTSYRAMYPDDFARAAAHNNLAIGTINTFILITSSATVALALWAVRGGLQRLASGLLIFSIGCGVLFLILKGVEYAQHFRAGIYPGVGFHSAELTGPGARLFFTLYYLITGLHAFHVVAGLAVLGWLLEGSLRGRFAPQDHLRFELGTLYWHLVDVVWIFVWPLLYLLHQ
jgi:cytochrome c oxidase subunit 3